jgi:hypothetical protein
VTEMIKRATKAILDSMDITDGLDGSAAERYAIAVFEAIREPTPEIAALSYCSDLAENLWPAMIDVARGQGGLRP